MKIKQDIAVEFDYERMWKQDTIQIAVDFDSGRMWWSKNGEWYASRWQRFIGWCKRIISKISCLFKKPYNMYELDEWREMDEVY